MKKLVWLLLLLIPKVMTAQATALTGTLNNPDGTGFNGQLILSLAQQASISSTNGCGGPVMAISTVQKIITVVNGALQGSPHIYGSDCTLPYGVPYNVIARDNQGNIDFTAQWLPQGTTQDIGTIQAVLNPLGTLFGLSLSDLALTGAENSFTQNNTFTQNVTVGGSLTVAGGIFGGVGQPVTVHGTGGAFDLIVYDTGGTANFEVSDNDNVTVTLGTLNVNGEINSNQGYAVGGSGGTTGQCLVSNGTLFVPGTCTGGTTPTLYYQHDYFNNTPLTQRSINNFLSPIVATDDSGGGDTQITLAASGVSAGSYGFPTAVSVDTYGRITSITGGSSSTQVIKSASVLPPTICTTATSAWAKCPTPVTWQTPFADANYVPSCTVGTPTNNYLLGFWIDPASISASGVTVWIQNGEADAAHALSVTSIFCVGVHN